MKLTMKSIIRWEQLNQKPFSQINYSNENDIISLFYVCKQATGIEFSLDEFKTGLTEDSIKEMVKDFERQISLVSQFQPESKKNKDEEKAEPNPVFIKDTVATLVMAGLDVYFALNDMELCDLPIFLQASDRKTKDRLISQRHLIFWLLKPHAGDKIETPKDLYTYDWETEEEPVSKEAMEEAKNEFKTFFKSGLTT